MNNNPDDMLPNEQWFPSEPDWSGSADWDIDGGSGADGNRGPSRGGSLASRLKIAVWLSACGLSRLEADPAIVQIMDEPDLYGTIIEARCSIDSEDIKSVRPLELDFSVHLSLWKDDTDASPAEETVIVSSLWPRVGNQMVRVTRETGAGGTLKLSVTNGEASVDAKRGWSEEFERSDPWVIPHAGGPAQGREVGWRLRSTAAKPSIEGIHNFGIWITAPRPLVLRAAVSKVKVSAESKFLGIRRQHAIVPVQPHVVRRSRLARINAK